MTSRAACLPLVATLCLAACDAGLSTPPAQPGIEGEAIDWSADPCADFYRFACGNWERWHGIQADGAARARFHVVQDALTDLAYRLMVEDVRGTPHDDDPDARKIGDYARTCRAALEGPEVTGPHLQSALAEIAVMTTPGQLADVVAHLHLAGVGALFSVGVGPDPDRPTEPRLFVGPGGYGMPAQYYLDADKASFRDAYRAHVDALVAVVRARGGLPPALTGELVLRVETALARHTPSVEEWRDPRALHHPTPIDVFETSVPSFDWSRYFQAAGVPAVAEVGVTWPPFLVALNDVLATTPPSELASYLAWRLLEADADALGWPIQNVEFDFHTRVFEGRASKFPPHWQCFINTRNQLGFALSRPFVAQVFDAERKAAAARILGAVRARMSDLLTTAPWLDEGTRAEALAKLAEVLPKIGFPDVWPSYDDYETSPTDYLANVVGRNAKGWRNAMEDLGQPFDRTTWTVAPLFTNAFYGGRRNDITFPAAILQPPFFDPARPAAANYGSIGSVMGHELTHGFDDQGRQYDGLGALRDWWSPAVAQEFDKRAACLVDQFDRVHPLPDAMVNGALTLGENIADLGGLKLAYAAFHADDGGAGEGAPGYFTPDQQFFIAHAQGWCEKYRPEYLRTLLENDPHAPTNARINGVVANMSEFAAAFSCGAGAPLAPVQRCEIW